MEKKRVVLYFEHGIQSSFILSVETVEDLLSKLTADDDDWITLRYDDDRGQPLKQLICPSRVMTVMVLPPETSSVQAVRVDPQPRQRFN